MSFAPTLACRGRALRVGKIVAVGRNYAEHAREMGAAPRLRTLIHHEVELVVRVSRSGRRLTIRCVAPPAAR